MEKLKSRKLWAFFITLLLNVGNGACRAYFQFSLDEATMGQINELCVYYLLGQAGVDALAGLSPQVSKIGERLGLAAGEKVLEKKNEKERGTSAP